MGVDRPRRGAGEGGEQPLSAPAVARVVPDLASFAVDGGFRYSIPEALADRVSVGSLVRVPLSGRRVRGFVVGIERDDSEGLKEVRTVSGAWPVFDREMLTSLRWAATHYLAPLAVVLGKAAPPNLPRQAAERKLPSVPAAASPAPAVSAAAAAGAHHRPVQVLGPGAWAETIRRLVSEPIRAGRSVMVVAPTVVEAMGLADELGGDFGNRVVEVADQSDATLTTAWSVAAAQSGLVVVGTPRVVWWPVRDLAMAVLVEEGRRGMKERQTPSIAAREAVRRRGSVERFPVVHLGRYPTTDTLAEGTEMIRLPGRLWPLVEVVDRTEEPPGGGVVTQRARAAIAATAGRGERVLVFTHRHGYAPASRCAACRTLRTCHRCGARPDPGTECARCGAALGACAECGGRRFEPLGAAVGRVVEELRRVVDADRVGEAGGGALVEVATERDLPGLAPVALSVAVDADGLVRGTNYRAGEEALGILTRVAAAVVPGRAHRMIVQTADPRHPIHAALRRGDPFEYLESELAVRADLGLPPAGEVIVVEVGDVDEPPDLDEVFEGVSVFGPAPAGDRFRWLVQGPDLNPIRAPLAQAIGRLRDRGARVRVDVDPREL